MARMVARDRRAAIFREDVPIDLKTGDLYGEVSNEAFFPARFKTRTVRKALNDANGFDCCCGTPGDSCDSVSSCATGQNVNFSGWTMCTAATGLCSHRVNTSCDQPDPGQGSVITAGRCCSMQCPPDLINLAVVSRSTGRGFSFLNAGINDAFAIHRLLGTSLEMYVEYQLCDAGLVTGTNDGYQIEITVAFQLRDFTQHVPGACYPAWSFPCHITPGFTPGNAKVFSPWGLQIDVTYRFQHRTNTTIFNPTNDCCVLAGGDVVEDTFGQHTAIDTSPLEVPSFDMNRLTSDEIEPWFIDSGSGPFEIFWGSSEILGLGTPNAWNGPGCLVCGDCT